MQTRPRRSSPSPATISRQCWRPPDASRCSSSRLAGCLKAECRPGQLSVGAVVEVKHTAATPVGAWIEAEATYTGRSGKLYAFEVVARDPGGEVMRGRHERAVIDEARLLEGAARRR